MTSPAVPAPVTIETPRSLRTPSRTVRRSGAPPSNRTHSPLPHPPSQTHSRWARRQRPWGYPPPSCSRQRNTHVSLRPSGLPTRPRTWEGPGGGPGRPASGGIALEGHLHGRTPVDWRTRALAMKEKTSCWSEISCLPPCLPG